MLVRSCQRKTNTLPKKAKNLMIHPPPKGMGQKPCQVILINPSWDSEKPNLQPTDSMGPNKDLIILFHPLMYQSYDPVMVFIDGTNSMK